MIEGVLQVGELSVRDIMIPRSQMDVIRVGNRWRISCPSCWTPPIRAFR